MSEDIQMMMEREAGMPESCPALGIGFFIRPVQVAGRSKAAGHPVFEDREWVKIVIPGDKNCIPERLVKESDKQRFPKAYTAFKSREQTVAVNGMPIEEWPQITRAQSMTFRASNVHTVEALANVSDGNIDKLGSGGRELRAKAQAFLAVSKDTAVAQQYKADNEKLMDMIRDQQRQITDLAAQLQKRGPGRPPKDEAA